jgi:sugar phosphate isomerase/epimerase
VYNEEYVDTVRELVLRKGLEVSAFGSYVNPLMPFYQKHFEEAFKIAKGLGTDLVRIWSAGGPSKSIHPENKRLIAFRLVSMGHWAQFRNFTLGLEMHNNNLTDSVASILDLISEARSAAIKTYYQPLFRPGADDPIDAAEKLAPQIVNVHAQNADAAGNACPITDGVVDYGKVVEILNAHGYDGYLEVEFVHGDDKSSALQRDRDYLASLISSVETPLRSIVADSV